MPRHASPRNATPGISHLANFRLPLYDLPYSLPKEGLDLRKRQVSVLDRVVQQARHDRVHVHRELGEEDCDGYGVDYEGLAGLSHLALVGEVGDSKGGLYLARVGAATSEAS